MTCPDPSPSGGVAHTIPRCPTFRCRDFYGPGQIQKVRDPGEHSAVLFDSEYDMIAFAYLERLSDFYRDGDLSLRCDLGCHVHQ